ncbi:MAG: aminoglycoside 3'-phosphotransferase [Lachnospiraceae bacterium]|nr:aminoglycoside 3'-phosphotransferase [Lachnospiraceae bacterium]
MGNTKKPQIPLKILQLTGDREYQLDDIGMSESQVYCFEDMVLKIEKERENSNNEHSMMGWLADKLPVPEILCFVQENHTNFLLMSRMSGEMSCSEELMKQPRELARVLAEGLKMLWKVDISDCPYKNDLDNKLRLARIQVQNNLCDTENVEDSTYGEGGFENPAELLAWLEENRPEEDLVFAHGDYCLPNIFVKDGHISGFIDLGNCGIADRYQDIALCYRSLLHNYEGKEYKDFKPEMLFEELGIEPDWKKIRYYILMDELF